MLSFKCNVRINPQDIYILGHTTVSTEVNKFHDVHSLEMM